MPALREHLEDLPYLIEHLYAARGLRCSGAGGPNLDALRAHAWPGNVRELRNVLERAWALSPDTSFEALRLWIHQAADQPALESVDTNLPFKEAKERWTERFEKRYLASVFVAHGENITRASEHAGINRRHFRELLRKHGLRDE
jgi:DNA-binding NtrC family response regulator